MIDQNLLKQVLGIINKGANISGGALTGLANASRQRVQGNYQAQAGSPMPTAPPISPPPSAMPSAMPSALSDEEIARKFQEGALSMDQANTLLNKRKVEYSNQNVSDASKIRQFKSAAGNSYTVPINPEYDKANVKKLVKKYFPKDQVDNAMKVIQAESGGEWWKVGDDYLINGDISQQLGQPIPSYGLFQIRAFPGRPEPDTLRNPEENVKYAAELYKRKGWQPWTTAQEMGLQ